MKKNVLALIAIIASLMLLMTGCSAPSESKGTADEYYDNGYGDTYSTSENPESEAYDVTPRMVIVRASFSLETTDYTAATNAIEQAVKTCNGYIENATSDCDESYSRGEYTLRIPVDKYEAFMQSVSKSGTVSNSSYSEEDISDQYYDTSARIEAMTAQRDRLRELMQKAESLSDLLVLEKELTEVQGNLDSLIGVKKRYENQVAYATVTVTVCQDHPMEYTPESFGSRIKSTFHDSFAAAAEVFKFAVIAIIWLLPLIITAAVVAVVLIIILKKHSAKNGKRKAEADCSDMLDNKTQNRQ